MKVELKKLKTFSNFGKIKNLSRQRVYKLVESGKFDSIDIDGVKFIILNQKATKYKKQV